MEKRLINTEIFKEEEKKTEVKLRPRVLKEYIGQTKVKENMNIFIKAAKNRGETLDHILLYGPPGLGKTTLANIIANEMEVNIKVTSGPAIEKPGDLAAILSGLSEGDILFIDEIHRLNRYVEEILYPAMEDYAIDIVVGKESAAKSIRIDLPKFTLIGATTRAGLLSSPLRDRFGVIQRLEMYTVDQLDKIVKRSSKVLNIKIEDNGSIEMARRSRGTPRIANRLLKRVRDFAEVKFDNIITKDVADYALNTLEVDSIGLDKIDTKLINFIHNKFQDGPVGLDTLAAAINEDTNTIEEVYEPYLIQIGFLKRTPRGRVLTKNAIRHIKKTK